MGVENCQVDTLRRIISIAIFYISEVGTFTLSLFSVGFLETLNILVGLGNHVIKMGRAYSNIAKKVFFGGSALGYLHKID